MNRYLNYNDFKKIDDFCKKKCKEIVLNSTAEKLNVYYNRGLYKGFLYLKKINLLTITIF